VLAVAVDLNRDIESARTRVLVARLYGPSDPDVVREPNDLRPLSAGDRSSGIGRAVVDDDDLDLGVGDANLVDHGGDAIPLVIGRHDGDSFDAGQLQARRKRAGRREPFRDGPHGPEITDSARCQPGRRGRSDDACSATL
jgi:hypothetical protein